MHIDLDNCPEPYVCDYCFEAFTYASECIGHEETVDCINTLDCALVTEGLTRKPFLVLWEDLPPESPRNPSRN
jgi:hypothetical protein